MDFDEIKNKSTAELTELLSKSRSELRVLNFKIKSNQLKQSQKLGTAKKQIARILSVLNTKKIS